jgi:hypothetical protein
MLVSSKPTVWGAEGGACLVTDGWFLGFSPGRMLDGDSVLTTGITGGGVIGFMMATFSGMEEYVAVTGLVM